MKFSPLLYIWVVSSVLHLCIDFVNIIIDEFTTAFLKTGLGRTAYEEMEMGSQLLNRMLCMPDTESFDVIGMGTIKASCPLFANML